MIYRSVRMNTVPWQQYFPRFGYNTGTEAGHVQVRTELRLGTLLLILTSFWVYVTISNVFYANSMQISMASLSDKPFFAPWTSRVLQHLFLYPVFIGCVWTSLRVGWQPLWRA